MGLILGWGSLQLCQSLVNELYNIIENVKNSLANNTDQNALKFDREENMTS